MTDEEAGIILDELRKQHPLNGAIQDLYTFVLHTRDNAGRITPQNALFLAEAAQQFARLSMAELQRLRDEISKLNLALMDHWGEA